MHPVAQFNITYAYSIVSRRRRRNRKGLCTPARFARDAQEGQKLVLHSNFLSDSCESCLASNQVSTKSRCLTITPRFTVICRDTDFRPNLRHLCLTRNGDRWRTHTSAIVQWNCSSLFESGVNFEKVEKFSRFFSLLVNFHRSFHPSGSIGALKTRQGPRNDVRYRLTRYRK